MEKFIIIAAGSFQGKSIVALHIAARFKFSGVLTTDMIRNFYIVNNGSDDIFSTATYKMSIENYNKQKEIVSDSLSKIMNIYQSRGEKMIFEGVHFSDQFIKSLKHTNYLKIFINNKLTPKERFKYKIETRNKFSFKDDSNKTYENTAYFHNEERMVEIHEELRSVCIENNFIAVDFTDINEAFEKCDELVKNYLSE